MYYLLILNCLDFSLKNKSASTTKARWNMDQYFTLRSCSYYIRVSELMPIASIISIKYEIYNLKCKFRIVGDIVMLWSRAEEQSVKWLTQGSLQQVSDRLAEGYTDHLTHHCLGGKMLTLSTTHKIEFGECYLLFASYFVNGPAYQMFNRHDLIFPLIQLLIWTYTWYTGKRHKYLSKDTYSEIYSQFVTYDMSSCPIFGNCRAVYPVH